MTFPTTTVLCGEGDGRGNLAGGDQGRKNLNDPGKWDRLHQWCNDASRLDLGQQYRALFVREEDWERYKPKSFRDAVAVFGGSEPELPVR